MATLKVRYQKGALVPLKPLKLPEETELEVIIEGLDLKQAQESFKQGWKEARSGQTRPVSDLWENINAKETK